MARMKEASAALVAASWSYCAACDTRHTAGTRAYVYTDPLTGSKVTASLCYTAAMTLKRSGTRIRQIKGGK